MVNSTPLHVCVIAAVVFAAGCASLSGYGEPPRVNLVDLQPEQMTLFEQRYLVQLRIQNPNPEPLDVTGMSYEVELNDRAFAEGVHGESFTVAPFGEQVIDVVLVSTLFSVIDQLQGLQTDGPKSLRYRLSGTLSLKGSLTRLKFERTGEMEFEGTETGTAL
jgi:LEA14-like dessication related protein